MLLGAVTYNVLKDWDLDTILAKLPELGFEAVELRTTHKHGVEPTASAAERTRIRNRFADSKLRLVSYGTVCEFQSNDRQVRAKNVADAKAFIDLAHDTGAWGIKVRPNGLPKEQTPLEAVVGNIAAALREVGDYGAGKGVEIWVEVHGRITQNPPVAAAIMKATKHDNVGLCWNSNPTDVVNGSVRQGFDLLKPWVKSAHINELADKRYPWRELFSLMRKAGYQRYTLCEAQATCEPERFLRWYRALWEEQTRA